MKFTAILILSFLTNLVHSQTTITSKTYGPLRFEQLDYGLASVVEGTEENAKNTPTGRHGWLKDFEIVKTTDSIEAIKGNHFGTVYQINSKDTFVINVVIEWIYPSTVVNEKREKYKSIKYNTKRPTNIPSASSYSLDEPYELVKGDWELNMYIENKKVYSRIFHLY